MVLIKPAGVKSRARPGSARRSATLATSPASRLAVTAADRSAALRAFVETALAHDGFTLAAASADASFRSYWRVALADGGTRIVMDAPPDRENVDPWLDVGARLRRVGLHAPEVLAVDREHGFILMEDLGSRAYLDALDDASADALYADALDALLRVQTQADPAGLPAFDEAFATTELELMPEWFLRRHLGHAVACEEWDVVELAFMRLIEAVRGQPQGFMHRDYHSRNLMVCRATPAPPSWPASPADPGPILPRLPNPGIIDFQGAMIGPITYDLASLLRDCYVEWDAERVEGWLESHRRRLVHAHLLDTHTDAARFRRWFDLTGLQRHVKVLGLFCRLCYRDGKPQYLNDLPRVWRYVISVASAYADLAPLADLLERALGERDIAQPRVEAA